MSNERNHSSTSDGYVARWPFAFLRDTHRRGVRWAVINARVTSPSRHAMFADLRRDGYRFVGMSSDMTFPLVDEPDPLDYTAACEAWCHCFRDPERYLPPHLPRTLLAASDFTDPHALADVTPAAPIDFVYVAATEGWKRIAKNWQLAQRCIPALCAAGYRGLVVAAPEPIACDGVEHTAWLPHRELLARLAGARFLFAPNELDASPRVLAEALCLDVPLVVNRKLLGGWHYVTSATGVWFDDEHDVVAAAAACLERPRTPRAWFRAHHGPHLAGARLLALLRPLDPSLTERSHLVLADAT